MFTLCLGSETKQSIIMDTKIHRFLDNRDFYSKNSLIHLLDDEYKESDEEVPNLITHSYYCCSKDLLNKINCVDGTTILSLNCQSLSAKYDSICVLLTLSYFLT